MPLGDDNRQLIDVNRREVADQEIRLLMTVGEGPPVRVAQDVIHPVANDAGGEYIAGCVSVLLKPPNDVALRRSLLFDYEGLNGHTELGPCIVLGAECPVARRPSRSAG